MPLRDHFRPPVWKQASWEGLHGMWPATMVLQLTKVLPPEFSAEPRAHLGSYFEIDVCAYEEEEQVPVTSTTPQENGGVATATWAPPEPTLTLETELSEQYEYEVLVYDQDRGRILVAAVEIVSPANKDRPENRRAFVAKCAALLQQRVGVSIVDLVTTRQFNLYTDLLELISKKDPAFGPTPSHIYGATIRGRKVRQRPRLDIWAYPLVVGRPLPTLPIWLNEDLAVSLDLEQSYEETCRALRIR
ncbi:MAG: DUF4058 family protein [Planctomycetes bacterium]|nr:DUF4058 family protein [Planctomycetota bacterium]